MGGTCASIGMSCLAGIMHKMWVNRLIIYRRLLFTASAPTTAMTFKGNCSQNFLLTKTAYSLKLQDSLQYKL